MATVKQDVEFKTLDGLTIAGWLFPAKKTGPAIIMTPGFNCTKDDFSDGLEEMIQNAGISVLLYDPRNTGCSEGWPRNEIDPAKQVADYYDALTFLTTLPIVEPTQIFFWGVSLSAGIALAAAAVDKRAAGVIAVAPSFDSSSIPKDVADKIMAKAMRDREAQMHHGNPPFFISAMEARGLVPLGSRMSAGAAPTDNSRLSHNPRGSTIQSYPNMRLWMPVPIGLLPEIDPMPVMFVTPENDNISSPETQKRLFATLTGPKKFHLALGRAHLDILRGKALVPMAKAKIEFVWQTVGNGSGEQNAGKLQNVDLSSTEMLIS